MSKLPERLSELMIENDLNAPKLAPLLGIDRASINRFLRGDRAPRFPYFVKMLYVFNCSADYLLGLKDIHTEETLHPVPPFKDRLRALLKEYNITQGKLIAELPVSDSVLFNWLAGNNDPSIDSLIRLSVYFDCTVDYLIGRVK